MLPRDDKTYVVRCSGAQCEEETSGWLHRTTWCSLTQTDQHFVYGTADLIEQPNLLGEVARLIDAGVLRSTLGENFGRINAANLKREHALLESGKARGKIVLEGF